MSKWLLTLKNLEPGNTDEDIVAVAETVPGDLHPEHPIVIPEPPEPKPPLVIWGGGNEPFPTPPIYIPPQDPDKPPEPPFVIWGPDDPRPTPPIVIPPQPTPPDPDEKPPSVWEPTFPTPPIYVPPQPPDGPGEPPIIGWDPCKPRPVHPIYIPSQFPNRPGVPPVVLTPEMDKVFRSMIEATKKK